MNFRALLNEVLRRLREETVDTDWTGDINDSPNVTAYQKLVAALINDAKRNAETYHDWFILRTTVDVPTVSGTRTYSLSSGQEIKVLDTVCQDTGLDITQVSKQYMNSVKYPTEVSGEPAHYAFNGADSSNNLKVEFDPTPNSVQTITFDIVKYQDDLATYDAVVKIPERIVILGAWARAIAERGEDGGTISSAVAAEAREALVMAIQVDSSNADFERDWQVV